MLGDFDTLSSIFRRLIKKYLFRNAEIFSICKKRLLLVSYRNHFSASGNKGRFLWELAHTVIVKKLFIYFTERKKGERKRDREREKPICYSTYIYIHWLIIICTLCRHQTCNLRVSGQCCNQLNYLARATYCDILTNVVCLGLNVNLI